MKYHLKKAHDGFSVLKIQVLSKNKIHYIGIEGYHEHSKILDLVTTNFSIRVEMSFFIFLNRQKFLASECSPKFKATTIFARVKLTHGKAVLSGVRIYHYLTELPDF